MRSNLCLVLLLCGHAAAQELVWERTGVVDTSAISGMVIVLGDVDGDGHDDLLQIAEALRAANPGPGLDRESQLWVLSGKDGTTLRIRPEYGPRRSYRVIAAAGDMDGDGVPDYAATVWDYRNPPSVDVVEVRSGKDDRLLWQVQVKPDLAFGMSLLGGLDLDGDRRPDLVVTVPLWSTGGDSHPGAVYAYANDGTPLYRVLGTSQLALGNFQSFHMLGRVGDVDRDGKDDFVVGGIDNVAGLGAAVVLSGHTGKMLVKGLSQLPGDALGHSVDGCGDLDGDGVPDFAAGSAGGTFELGVVQAFSGRTGKTLLSWQAAGNTSSFGWALKSGGQDLDRDGVPDLVIGAPDQLLTKYPSPSVYGAVYVYSGRDGEQIHRLTGCSSQQPSHPCYLALPGNYLDIMPPQPGSPFALFAVVDPRYDLYISTFGELYRGRVRLLRGSPSGAEPFGASCRGTLSTSPKIGIRDLGPAGVRIHLSNAAPGSRAALLLGFSRVNWAGMSLPLALDPLGFLGCELYTSIDLWGVVTAGTSGIDRGYAFVDLRLPLATSGQGSFTIHGQWLSLGTANSLPGALSDALLWHH